ncbi:MAG: hypothetical protein WCK91_02080 [bacterium]
MIAFTVLSIVLSGVVLADFGVEYWTITSQTSSGALYKAKTHLEELRASARQNFYQIVSSPLTPDNCVDGQLCYFTKDTVTDISPCSKYAQVDVSWQVDGYPISNTTLSTYLTDPAEAITLGGDCILGYPSGPWTNLVDWNSSVSIGTPVGLDSLNGRTYIVTDTNPYLQILSNDDLSSGSTGTSFANGFIGAGPYSAIDVARDIATGRSYAYISTNTNTNQLQVVDVTDSNNPENSAQATLKNVASSGSAPGGFRITYSGPDGDPSNGGIKAGIYILTQSTTGPEFHIFDATSPSFPSEVGSRELGMTAYGMTIRDQIVSGVLRRFVYLAVGSSDPKELMVLDVTNPKNITQVVLCTLAGNYKATSVFILGNTLYLGRDLVPAGNSDLYAFDASDPTLASFCNPIGQADTDSLFYSNHVIGIRGSGPYLYVAVTNTTSAHGEVQIRNSDPATNFALISKYSFPAMSDHSIDFDGSRIYMVGRNKQVKAIFNKQ